VSPKSALRSVGDAVERRSLFRPGGMQHQAVRGMLALIMTNLVQICQLFRYAANKDDADVCANCLKTPHVEGIGKRRTSQTACRLMEGKKGRQADL
jgi:hypothetical protein